MDIIVPSDSLSLTIKGLFSLYLDVLIAPPLAPVLSPLSMLIYNWWGQDEQLPRGLVSTEAEEELTLF